mgnify:CR=1 FL=1
MSLSFCSPSLTCSLALVVGSNRWAAIETAKKAPEGSVLLAMLPDTGERYLSTPLFAEIEADMNEEELAITKTTPNYQLLPQ